MARIMPTNIAERRLGGESEAELATLERLGRDLPDDYTVFHSRHVAELTHRRQQFGEIDFVIVNQSGDVLLIEQKNGPLGERLDDLVVRYSGAAQSKSVIEQIHRSREIFLAALKAADMPHVTVSSLLYCPDHRVESVTAAGLSLEGIVDAADDARLPERIQALLPAGISKHETPRLMRDFLMQSLSLEQDMTRTAEQHEAVYRRLSSPLQELPAALEFTPWRLRIQAAAGSGKSLVAIEAYERAIARGERPLLACFNRPLADSLQHRLGDTEHVNNFHGHCNNWLAWYGDADRLQASKADGGVFWDELVDQMADIADKAGPYDLLIIDEGQDFKPDWYEVLSLAMKPDYRCLWLEDEDQSLQGNPGVALEGFVHYNNRRNFRTPARIARFIDKLLDKNIEWANPLDGYAPTLTPYSTPAEQIERLDDRVQALMRQGFAADQIAIVSLRGRESAIHNDLNHVAGENIRRYTGRHDENEQPVHTVGPIQAETIYRFKGQQAPAVVLTDIELSGEADKTERETALLWCGLTRATVACELLVNDDCGWLKAMRRAAK